MKDYKENINMKGLTMRRRRKSQRRVIASILTGMFIVQQTMTLSVMASEISGVSANGNIFNIDPTHVSGDMGFRHYEKFNLDQGDIANLNYTDISSFVNLVDNQISINGIVNTVRGGNFHAGKAIFISPNGMVVGASGVLNVGSLGVYTPSQASYNNFAKQIDNGTATELSSSVTSYAGGGTIRIDGKVISAGDVNMRVGNVEIGNTGGIVAGVNADQMSVITSQTQANNLFNSLVNTDNLTTGSQFASNNGVIEIKTGYNENGGINIAGNVVNYNAAGTGTNISLHNEGKSGINIAGTLANNKGTVNVQNLAGDLNISGNVINDGTTTLKNAAREGNLSGYTLTPDTKLNITDTANIQTKGTLEITNTGTEGMVIAGTINHDGTMNIANGAVETSDTIIARNAAMAAMEISGTLNNAGETNITNYAAGGLNVTNAGNINSNGLNMLNTGVGGFTMNGTATNIGTADLTNEAGGMNIGGTFTNTGDATILNNGTILNVTGNITNNTGDLSMVNNGAGGFNVTETGNIDADDLDMVNNGIGGMNINGEVTNIGEAYIENKAGGLNIAGHIDNNGNATIINNGTAINLTGEVNNQNGQLDITNNGTGGFNLDGTVSNIGNTNLVNNAGQFNIGGTVTGNGNTNILNDGTELTISGNVQNQNGKLDITNNNGDLDITTGATVSNNNETVILNKGANLQIDGNITNAGDLAITNDGTGALAINGTVTNTGTKTNIVNNGANLTVSQTGKVDTNGLTMTNNKGNLQIDGTVTNKNNAKITNNGDALNITGKVVNADGSITILNEGDGGLNLADIGIIETEGLEMINNGAGGLNIDGTVTNVGTATISNNAGNLVVNGTVDNTGNATLYNNGNNFTVNGTITNREGTLALLNEKGALDINNTGKVSNTANTTITNNGVNGLNIHGTVTNGGTLDITNTGLAGLNIDGTVTSVGDITATNSGERGVNIASTGRVNGDNNITINNTAKGGVNVKGLVNAKKNVNINSNTGNVVIGDNTENNNYVTAGNDINIVVVDGSILNYGVEKTLLNATGNLNMDVTDGTIGLGVQQTACQGSGCTGIGPKADGSRDFTKSINGKIQGKVNATTRNTKAVTKPDDLVINYAAIDSDMNIDAIKADGRVILTVDDDFGYNNNGPRYNMINARTDNTDTNIEGWGISLIANGSIGTNEKAVTFIQNGAADGHSMDVLVNENINLKENSFNDADYGREKEVTTNKACTIIAREGDIDIEFAGNTTIENITAEGDMKVVTRGKNLNIKNIGHIEDPSVTPADYFGERHDGYAFDQGYDQADHKSEVLPNHVELKALDINHNIRPTQEVLEGGYEAYADSTVRVDNAVLDNGTMDITADNIYANGVAAHFNQEGFSKVADDSTSKVKGASEIPTGHAVRPDDVTDTGRGETERNYYYPEGDGDGIFNGEESNVDDDDNIADDTPLEIPDKEPDPDPTPDPTPEPTPEPEPEQELVDADGSDTYIQRKIIDENVDSVDKRQYMRFNVSDSARPVMLENTNNGVDQLIDISRGGIAVKHDNALQVGDVIPVHLTYGDLDINAEVKVVTSTADRAGAMFVNIDQATANKLLYLNILLEDASQISFNE